MKISIVRTVAALGVLALASSAAHAGPESPNSLSYKADASFDNSRIRWTSGSQAYKKVQSEYIEWGDPSYLQINDWENTHRFVTFKSTGGGLYQYQSGTVASLVHHNDPISSANASLTFTEMSVSVDVLGTTLTWDLDIRFSETLNDPGFGQTCAAGTGGKPCGDIFVIDWDGRSGTDVSYSFDPILSGGYEYVVTIGTNDVFSPLSAQACSAAGAAAGCIGFVTAEKATTYVDFNVSISASPVAVPEPETYAMLLAGLGIVGMVARRRRITPRT